MTSSFPCLKYSLHPFTTLKIPLICAFVTIISLCFYWWPPAVTIQRCFLECGNFSKNICSPSLLLMTNGPGGGWFEESSLIWIRKESQLRLREMQTILVLLSFTSAFPQCNPPKTCKILLTTFAHSSRLPTRVNQKCICVNFYRYMCLVLS